MAFETVLNELKSDDSTDANKILESLLNPKNIDMKTHIMSPVTFAILETVVINIESLLKDIDEQKIKLPMTKKILKDLLFKLKVFLVSWDRKSRKEITETLQSLRAEGMQERSLFQKLIGTGK